MIKNFTNLRAEVWFMVGAMAILGGTFWLHTAYLMWGDWTYDQGFYFLVARLMDQGFSPYQEIHMSEQPLMAWSVHIAFQLTRSIWGMQAFMVAYAMTGVAALIYIGRVLEYRRTGLLVGLLLVAHYEFFRAARLVNPETTSLSLALVAIALALHYRVSGRRYWLVASALAMAASLLLKLFLVVAIPLISLIVTFYYAGRTQTPWKTAVQDKKRILIDNGLWLGLIAAILMSVWIAIGFPAWLEQSVIFYINRNAAHARDLAFNFGQIWSLVSGWPILLVLTIWGIVRSIRQIKTFGWVVLIWMLLTLLFLMSFTPLRSKHLIVLIPPFALLAALALSHLIGLWQSMTGSASGLKWGFGVVLLLVTMALTVELVSPFHRLVRPLKPLVRVEKQPIVEALQKYTSPNDCIITDDPYIAFAANRLPPPWLSNMSYARFRSGSLDKQDLIDITTSFNCQVIVPTFDRLKNTNREYYDLAKAHYLRVWVINGAEIMLGKPLEDANPSRPTSVNFSNQVELIGLDWVTGQPTEANQAHLSLYWKKLSQPFLQNYKIFVQLRNSAGQIVSSADHEVFDGLIQTSVWRPDTITKGTTRIMLPADIPPGSYDLFVGLYDPNTLERLTVLNDSSNENAAVIPEILIK